MDFLKDIGFSDGDFTVKKSRVFMLFLLKLVLFICVCIYVYISV